MARIDLWFLLLATACLICGVALGIGMGIAHDFHLAPVHAHLNLLGWASLALFGLVYRAYPAMARGVLPRLHLGLAAPSAVLFPVGIYLSIEQQSPGVAIAASLLWFAGVVLFLIALARLALGAAEPRAMEMAPAE